LPFNRFQANYIGQESLQKVKSGPLFYIATLLNNKSYLINPQEQNAINGALRRS